MKAKLRKRKPLTAVQRRVARRINEARERYAERLAREDRMRQEAALRRVQFCENREERYRAMQQKMDDQHIERLAATLYRPDSSLIHENVTKALQRAKAIVRKNREAR